MREGQHVDISTGMIPVELEGSSLTGGLQSDMSRAVFLVTFEGRSLTTDIGVNPSIVECGPINNWFGESRKKLNELSALKDDWDSYSAPSPNAVALEWAENFLDDLGEFNIRPVHMGPCVAGGVGFTFLGTEQEYVVEFENNGCIRTSMIESEVEPISVVTNDRSTDIEPLDIIIEELQNIDGI